MKRYLIERDIAGIGGMSGAPLKDIAATSNGGLAELAGKVQWVQSFIGADKTFCIYLADSEELVHEHARLTGFPVTRVTEVARVLDPMTPYTG
jgi:hypothetical protein